MHLKRDSDGPAARARSKFVVARNGDVVGRYCPPLRPALLVRGVAPPPRLGPVRLFAPSAGRLRYPHLRTRLTRRFRRQSAAIAKMLGQAPLLQPLHNIAPPKAAVKAAPAVAMPAVAAKPAAEPLAIAPIAVAAASFASIDAPIVPVTPPAVAAVVVVA